MRSVEDLFGLSCQTPEADGGIGILFKNAEDAEKALREQEII